MIRPIPIPKKIVRNWYEGQTIILRTGDKIENFSHPKFGDCLANQPTISGSAAAEEFSARQPVKKDPRTFIGWALKSFFD